MPARPSVSLTAALFLTWALLSGHFDAAHLGAGAAVAFAIARVTSRLWSLPPAIGPTSRRPFEDLRWGRGLGYLGWLVVQIGASGVQVAYLVLHPRLPIDPKFVRFRTHLPHTLARLTLANSITLTPGTVTLEVDHDDFMVHALTSASASTIADCEMQDRVAALFAPAGDEAAGGDDA
jgi:multicomponent Na+:H+ antiporter subunit E